MCDKVLGMSGVKRTPCNICVQAGRESRGIVSPFSPASVCNLFVSPNVRRWKYMHRPRQSVKETYRVRSTYLYRDIIPNNGGSDFKLTLIIYRSYAMSFFSLF